MKKNKICSKEPREQCVFLRIVSEKLKTVPDQFAEVPGTTETSQIRCQGPKPVPESPCYWPLCLHLHIIITDVYNRAIKKGSVLFGDFHSKRLGNTETISERIANPSPSRFIP